jgi:predicted O-methyltransferase YrrM
MASLVTLLLQGPAGWRQLYRDVRDRRRFEALPRAVCDTAALGAITRVNLSEILNAPECHADWPAVERQLTEVGISNRGGSNSGDSRAVYYLVRYLRPQFILEIGTRLGATTARMALALQAVTVGGQGRLITVDIDDVNADAQWSSANRYSPRESIERLGMGRYVSFVTRDSLNYLARVTEKFDLIFLDGSHDAWVVYQELPLALKALRPGGFILLHDYYPMLRPLWEEAEPIAGPYLAIRRLQHEGVPIQVLPFGNLPWWARTNSSATSLALVGAK